MPATSIFTCLPACCAVGVQENFHGAWPTRLPLIEFWIGCTATMVPSTRSCTVSPSASVSSPIEPLTETGTPTVTSTTPACGSLRKSCGG